MPPATPLDPTFFETPLRAQFDTFIDEHRQIMVEILDDLTEDEARRSLVPSRTTLLGLVKHATFVEKVWFNEAITGRGRAELGLPEAAEDSFLLDDSDTIDSVRRGYLDACAESRERSAALTLDDPLTGNRRGPLPLRWVLLHVLREVAQHCGHAEILREQILAAREEQHG